MEICRVCGDTVASCKGCPGFRGRSCTVDSVTLRAYDALKALTEENKRLREELQWISAEERLPENEVDVLILAERRLYGIPETDGRKHYIVATAFHTDGKMNTEDSGYNWELWDTGAEYDEEVDAYIIPEGGWEAVRYGEEFSAVDDFVTHWKPMPTEEAGVHWEPRTRLEQIRCMSLEELAQRLLTLQDGDAGSYCRMKPECVAALEENRPEIITDQHCLECVKAWLMEEV